MTMRSLTVPSAVLALLLMPPAWSAPQQSPQEGPQKGLPADQGDSSSQQDHKGQQGDSDQKQPDEKQPDQKPPDGKDSGGWSSSSASSTAAIKTPPQELPKYNPLPAEQDIEVGTYYMHKGDTDAAISRFEDAIQLKADYAKPRMLLAQIYEKKGDKMNAAKYYKEYLQVYPHAPDAVKVQAKIEKLTTR